MIFSLSRMPILELLMVDSGDVDEINSSWMDDTLESLDGSMAEEQSNQNTEFTDPLNKFKLKTAINLSYLVTSTSFRGANALHMHVENTEDKYNIVIPQVYKRATSKMGFLDTMEKSSQCVVK